jgi:hypothetical protein
LILHGIRFLVGSLSDGLISNDNAPLLAYRKLYGLHVLIPLVVGRLTNLQGTGKICMDANPPIHLVMMPTATISAA